MTGPVVGAVLIIVATGYTVGRVRRWLATQWFLIGVWHWLSGWRLDGKPGRARRAWTRTGATGAAMMLAAGWLADRQVTDRVILALTAAAAGLGAWWVWRWVWQFRHRRVWLRPLHLAAHDVAQIDRRRAPQSWLQVDRARTRAVLELPAGWSAEDKDKQRLLAIASRKLGMESPEPSWRLAGPKPLLILEASSPPPPRVTLDDARRHILAARRDEVVWGIGKRGEVVKSSLSGDSPHLGLSMGSGAGKSVTARALLAQMLYHGAVGLILDYKMISHQWARDLPNVAIVRRPHEIHAALMWLGGEAERRNEVALAGSDMDGNVHAVVGARLIVVCEELNATMSKLRAYWRGLRNVDKTLPQRSPALEALDAVNLMGRQVEMNLIYMGQRLSVKAVGGDGDARESIGVIAFGRFKAGNWKMLAPDFAMPPNSVRPGRIQVVSDRVQECQAVFPSAAEARELATGGMVTPCPAGMPGASRVLTGTQPQRLQNVAPGMPVVSETGPVVPALPGRVTLSEAVAEGIVSCSLHAVRKASQRDASFPVRAGLRGLAGEYDPVELAEWDAVRRG